MQGRVHQLQAEKMNARMYVLSQFFLGFLMPLGFFDRTVFGVSISEEMLVTDSGRHFGFFVTALVVFKGVGSLF